MKPEELRELREKAGLSRKVLANKIPGLNFRTIESWEQGRRRIPVWAQAALRAYF